MAATTDTTSAGRTPPQIGRVRRGWLYRDTIGSGWWVDDTVLKNGAHQVVQVGDRSAQYRVFTPMVGAREAGRQLYRFSDDDDHGVSLRTVARQLAEAAADPPTAIG